MGYGPGLHGNRTIQAQIRMRFVGYEACDSSGVPNPGSKPFSESMTPDSARPVCDEWGMYDPEQAGFEAIIRLLPDEDDTDQEQALTLPRRGTGSTRRP